MIAIWLYHIELFGSKCGRQERFFRASRTQTVILPSIISVLIQATANLPQVSDLVLSIIVSLLLTFFVPQGAEHRAVCQGLKHLKNPPPVISLPIGVKPVTQFLTQWLRSPTFAAVRPSGIVVMGLCGSLTPLLGLGDRVLYQTCLDESGTVWECDPTLTTQIQQLQENISLVRAFTSDRIITSAQEKQILGSRHQADVVDMEGSAILEVLALTGCPIAMLRVVSDDLDHDLPDLSAALSPEGSLRSWPLAIAMMRQPIAALNLIRGSLKGLQTLRTTAARLGQSESFN